MLRIVVLSLDLKKIIFLRIMKIFLVLDMRLMINHLKFIEGILVLVFLQAKTRRMIRISIWVKVPIVIFKVILRITIELIMMEKVCLVFKTLKRIIQELIIHKWLASCKPPFLHPFLVNTWDVYLLKICNRSLKQRILIFKMKTSLISLDFKSKHIMILVYSFGQNIKRCWISFNLIAMLLLGQKSLINHKWIHSIKK